MRRNHPVDVTLTQTGYWEEGPCVISSEVGADTHYSTDIIITPPPQWQEGLQGSLGGESLTFNRGGKGEEIEGHKSFPTLFSSVLPVVIHLSIICPLFAVLHLLVVMALPSPFSFVQQFDSLHQVALEGRQRSTDGRSTKPMGEQAEVGEASLDTGLQARSGSTASQWGTVLGYEVHKLLTDLSEREQDVNLSWIIGLISLFTTWYFYMVLAFSIRWFFNPFNMTDCDSNIPRNWWCNNGDFCGVFCYLLL